MKHRDSFYRLEDVIDMDDAFVGGNAREKGDVIPGFWLL